MICVLISTLAAFAAYHFLFLKPKWLQFVSDPTFPKLNRKPGYWSMRGQFELQLWLVGINRASRGCTYLEQAIAAVAFIMSAILASTLCHSFSGGLK